MLLYPRKRKEKQGIVVCHDGPLQLRVIQARELEPRIMRYELTDHEWAAIKAMLPNKPRGVPKVNDRRVLNGIFCPRPSEIVEILACNPRLDIG